MTVRAAPRPATKSRKAVKPVKPVTKKTAKPKSKMPLLDAALAETPHAGGVWNKDAAEKLAEEAVSLMAPGMALVDALKIMVLYKNVAGWKTMVRAATVKFVGAGSGR